MPRKTKEQKELENENKIEKTVKKATTTNAKVNANQKPTTTEKTTGTNKKANTTKKATSQNKRTTATKKNSTKATSTTQSKTVTTKNKTSKSTNNKKNTTTKRTTKKANSKNSTSSKKKVEVVEYYDLPYRYNQTVVKVLAQTPTNLFIYWDISDKDRKNFQKQYGDNFFETTKPILIVYNDTLGYQFEVEINDFANSWYLHVADSKCNYRIELGRRPITQTKTLNTTDYIYITTSNKVESPNDRILFDTNQKMVYFRNVKTGQQTEKQVSSISFIRNMGKIYNIYDLYKAIYQDENIEEIYDLSNPSSGNPSSKFK